MSPGVEPAYRNKRQKLTAGGNAVDRNKTSTRMTHISRTSGVNKKCVGFVRILTLSEGFRHQGVCRRQKESQNSNAYQHFDAFIDTECTRSDAST